MCLDSADDDFCISITNNSIDALNNIVATPKKLKATEGISRYLKNIVNKLAINANPASVCIDLTKNSLSVNSSICSVNLPFALSSCITLSCRSLINLLRELYLFPKTIIINGIAGNNNAGYQKFKSSIKTSKINHI